MIKVASALIAALAIGGAVAGFATGATAGSYGPGCRACGGGPLPTKTYVKTVHPTQMRTRFHDVSVFRRVPRIQQIVNVTRVQPIIRIHDVTRVHHRTVFFTQPSYSAVTQNLPPITYVQSSTQNLYDCGCRY